MATATELGQAAVEDGVDLVVVHGGDGTVSGVVNGMLGRPGQRPSGHVPAVAVVPGGSANVLARSLGISPDPVAATNQLIQLIDDYRRAPDVAPHRPDRLRRAVGRAQRRDGRRRRGGGRGGGAARQGRQGHADALYPGGGARAMALTPAANRA